VRRAFAAIVSFALLGACGYFNAMYNARQQFDEGRRAAARGESSAATNAYRDAIERAASSFRNHPDSRWADDALLLIARARWELGEHAAARAAAEELLLRSGDAGLRAAAHAYAGAAALRSNDPIARMHLDSAAARDEGEFLTLALLSRAKLRFRAGEGGAWTDLERASAGSGDFASEARLEAAARAVAEADTARMRLAFASLFDDRAAGRWNDSIAALLDIAAARAGARFAWSLAAPIENARWVGEERNGVRFRRIHFLAKPSVLPIAATSSWPARHVWRRLACASRPASPWTTSSICAAFCCPRLRIPIRARCCARLRLSKSCSNSRPQASRLHCLQRENSRVTHSAHPCSPAPYFWRTPTSCPTLSGRPRRCSRRRRSGAAMPMVSRPGSKPAATMCT
jgi:hypothetical protein